jgi:hypothetical protein
LHVVEENVDTGTWPLLFEDEAKKPGIIIRYQSLEQDI